MQTASAEKSELDLDAFNVMFETSDPARVVEWTAKQFGPGNVVMSSSFGAESAVLLHMATQVVPHIKVIFVNTGYLFPETHAHMEALRLRLNLNVWIYRTKNDPITWHSTLAKKTPPGARTSTPAAPPTKTNPLSAPMAAA